MSLVCPEGAYRRCHSVGVHQSRTLAGCQRGCQTYRVRLGLPGNHKARGHSCHREGHRRHGEDLFNEVYDTEHVPELLKVPGVRSVTRYKVDSTIYTTKLEDQPVYIAAYEVDSPDVVTSDAWNAATEIGRWAEHVHPYTSNRSHVIYKKVAGPERE